MAEIEEIGLQVYFESKTTVSLYRSAPLYAVGAVSQAFRPAEAHLNLPIFSFLKAELTRYVIENHLLD
jgi:dTDP-4-amino-4,6-dideoxygalactose transaminase